MIEGEGGQSETISVKAPVSVIIPTFNRSRLLERAVQSVLQQTRAPEEVIVVDDGSTDKTVQRFPNAFPTVKFLPKNNQGVSAARNRGIHEATGDWLAFLDSDDEWLPQKLEEQFAALEKDPEYRMSHTNEIWIRRGRRVNPMKKHRKYGGCIFDKCLPLCTISPSSALVHRSVLEKVGTFDESFEVCEDYELWLRICSQYPVLYLEEPLIVKYGGHEDQLSHSTWGLDRFRIRALEKLIQSETLSSRDRRAVVTALLEKIDIYVAGARRREKWDDVSLYEEKRERYGIQSNCD